MRLLGQSAFLECIGYQLCDNADFHRDALCAGWFKPFVFMDKMLINIVKCRWMVLGMSINSHLECSGGVS